MSDIKKIIAALLLTVFTVTAGCIIVDCSMADLTKERPYTFTLANQIRNFAMNQITSLMPSVKGL